ncbi:hypothetical protein KIW84_056352 [Lathyrus oleraceus]|uniref:Uncharacterized protein n=1 Tax=Pisum sativum TaxID=3888 RepID=A0A9D4X2N9_PEA|nr:hypothetical protein KIW84_056352 [Pisum sativum]
MVPLRSDQMPPNYDENAECEFHSGTPGHNIEGCRAFKHVVQDLVDSKAINFAPSPNVNDNPMPAHGQAMVGAIAEDSDHACAVGEETDNDCEFDGEEDCDLLELARLLKQEEKVIQPHEEKVELVILCTEEVRKEVKVGSAFEASVTSEGNAIRSQEHRCYLSESHGDFVS